MFQNIWSIIWKNLRKKYKIRVEDFTNPLLATDGTRPKKKKISKDVDELKNSIFFIDAIDN